MNNPAAMGLLLGGKSHRMCENKAMLPFDGVPAWKAVCAVLSQCGTVYLSVSEEAEFWDCPYPIVPDEIPNCGPMGGLTSLLKSCKEDRLFLCACDMPQMSANFIHFLEDRLSRQSMNCEGIVVEDELGRLYPTAAIYKKSFLPRLEKAMLEKQYRMSVPIREGNFCILPLQELPKQLEAALLNVNTKSEYQSYCSLMNQNRNGGDQREPNPFDRHEK